VRRSRRTGRADPRRSRRSRTSCALPTRSASGARGSRVRSMSTATSSACSACVTASVASRSAASAAHGSPPRRCAWRGRAPCGDRRSRSSECRTGRAAALGYAETGRRCAITTDVSNRFYAQLLGPSLVYSCAYFASAEDSLERAQERKLELICRKLRLQPDERLLDIGCGWGSLVLHAAARHGVNALGVTLSEPQAELARQRSRLRAWPTASSARARLSRARRAAVRQESRASACTSTSAARSSTPTSRWCTGCCARAAVPQSRHHAHPHATAARSDVHQPLRVPGRRAASVTDIIGALEAVGSRSATSNRCASTTRSRCDAGSRTWPRGARAAVAEIGRAARARMEALHARLAQGFEGGEIGIYQTLGRARRRRARAPARPLGPRAVDVLRNR